MKDLLGDLPLKEPNHEIKLYRMINVRKRCTPILGRPMGTLENLISQNSGQETPPLKTPQRKNNEVEITSSGKNATAVWVGFLSSGYS